MPSAAMPELATGKSDMLVVNPQGKDSLVDDPPFAENRQKFGQNECN
jgi:hypothetical protein